MGEGLHFLDLIFYAIIAAFLIARLRSVLGRRTGYKQPPRPFRKNNGRSERREPESADLTHNVTQPQLVTRKALPPSATSLEGLEGTLVQMQIADPRFSTESFLHGAQIAFKTIISAFAAGERLVLRPLLSEAVFNDFSRAIESRAQVGESNVKYTDTRLLGTPTVEILSARMQEWTAFITLRFVSEQTQTHVEKNHHDKVVMNDAQNNVYQVVDIWTFSRDLRSVDPNWTLIQTRSEH